MAGRHVVARVADIPDGERLIVDVNGRSIGIFNVGGRFYGLLNRCPHAGAEMCRGQLVGTVSSERPGEYEYDRERKYLMCPWHGWEFDIETGRSYFDPSRTRLRAYTVERTGGDCLQIDLAKGDVALAAELAGARESGERVEGPFRAELIEVTVEDEYVVVDLRPRKTSA